jgi:UDP-GlcNAc:undecaprenyl-phosphate GlcNAc-1-phosphate transferase
MLTPFVRKLVIAKNLLDRPDKRKVHKRAVPSLGGISIYISFIIVVISMHIITHNVISSKVYGIIIASLIIVAMGIYDDIKDMPALFKLCGQVSVALIVYAFGFRVEEFFGLEATTFWFKLLSLLITTGWIVGIINAINLIDGLDGLACGVCTIISFFLFITSLSSGDFVLIIFAAALTASCLGFLPYNFHPASIFMGDTGSMFLGFMLSIIALESYQKSTTFIAILVPIIAMAVPLIDTSLSVVRRLISKKPLFKADKNHIHHRLLINEKSHTKVVLTLYSVTFFFGLIALGLKDIKGIYMLIALAMVSLVTFRWIKNSGFLDVEKK